MLTADAMAIEAVVIVAVAEEESGHLPNPTRSASSMDEQERPAEESRLRPSSAESGFAIVELLMEAIVCEAIAEEQYGPTGDTGSTDRQVRGESRLHAPSAASGFTMVEIVDVQKRPVSLVGERTYVLSEGQTYQLRVTIKSKAQEPSGGVVDIIHLTSGQAVDTVDFRVSLDCDSLVFQPRGLELSVGTGKMEAVTGIARLIADKEGRHDVFVVIYQRSALMQVIRLELEVR